MIPDDHLEFGMKFLYLNTMTIYYRHSIRLKVVTVFGHGYRSSKNDCKDVEKKRSNQLYNM